MAQGCTASRWSNQDSNPGSQALKGYAGRTHSLTYPQKALPIALKSGRQTTGPRPTVHSRQDQKGLLARGSPLFDRRQYQAQPSGEGIQAGLPREAPRTLGHETETQGNAGSAHQDQSPSQQPPLVKAMRAQSHPEGA